MQLQAHADNVRVIVRVTGLGIAADLLPRVFELFTQAPQENAPRQRGLGIGLYLVKRLVHMHGGAVAAESAGLGEGSCSTVTLPRVPYEPDTRSPADVAPASASNRVLVADDNQDAAESLAQLLQVLGHVPATAHDGASALDGVRELAPHVVLLDIGLPDMSGYEVARRIRACAADAWLVALTGWGQPEDKRKAAEAGFDAHWTKPIDLSHLESI